MALNPLFLRRGFLTAASFAFTSACASAGPRPTNTQQPGVSADQLEHSTDPIESIIQMRVSGLTVIRTDDGGIALQIRGSRSFDGSSDAPLFLVDDSPFEPGPMGALSGIDPANIASIKVIKGPEAAIYGIRGSNGVIVITTKRASFGKH